VDALQLARELLPCQRVQGRERLVHQHDLRLLDERAAQRDPLLHAAGQLVREPLVEPGEADKVEQLAGAVAVCRPGPAEDLDRQQYVVEHRTPRQQRRALEDQRDVPTWLHDGRSADEHLAARRRDKARNEPQQGGLPAARAADDRNQLAHVDVEVDAAQCLDRPLATTEGL
jgi:hypothetical protein